MKILVLGSTGMLGHVVSQYFFERQYEVLKTTRKISITSGNPKTY